MKKAFAACLACSLFILHPSSFILSAAPPSFAEWLPETTALYFSVPDARQLGEAFRRTQIYKLCEDPRMQPFVQRVPHILDGVIEQLQDDVGLRFLDMLHLPVGQVGIALMARPNPDRPDRLGPAGLMALVDVEARTAAACRVMGALEAKSLQTGAARRVRVHGDVTITEIRFPVVVDPATTQPMRSPGWAYFLDGSLLAVAHHVDDLVDVLEARAGRAPAPRSLAANPGFRRVQARIGPQQICVYVDFRILRKFLARLLAEQAGMFELVVQALGLDQIESLGVGASFSQNGFDGVVRAMLLVGGKEGKLPKLFHLKPGPAKVEPFVPADVASYISVRWDLPGFYDELMASFRRIDPRLVSVLEVMLRQGLGLGDLDFRRELIKPLDERISLYRIYRRPLTFTSPKGLFALQLADAARFQKGLNKLLGALPAGVRYRPVHGAGMFIVGDEESGNVQALAVTDSYLLVSEDPRLVKDAIARLAGRGPDGLASLEAFRRVAKHVPPNACGFSFYNLRRVGRYVHHLFRTNQVAEGLEFVVNMLGRNGRLAASTVDGTDLPLFAEISHYFGVAGGYLVVDDEGLFLCHFSLRPKPER